MYGFKGRKRSYSLSRNWGSQKGRMAKRRRTSQFNGSAYYAPWSGTPRSLAQKSSASIARIGSGSSYAPDAMYTILKWSNTYQLAATPSNRNVIRGNSCFDPGFTAGSSQPVGFDEWATIYFYYRVLWSKITVMFVGRTSATDNQLISVYPSLSSNPFTSAVDSNASQAYGKSRVYQAGNSPPQYIKQYMTTKKMYGDRSDTDTTYSALTSANPNNSWYWVTDVIQFSGGNADTTSYIKIDVQYGVRFEGKQNLSMS